MSSTLRKTYLGSWISPLRSRSFRGPVVWIQWCGSSGADHRELDEVDILRAFPVVGDNTVGSTETEA